ncbi:hypothetical protein [Shimia abyssi]|uniref:PBP domain-containing protein n=1 Tax=Shimia abyssi TaxID=1662395 RepID=A0A2P8FE68_9RHOB|nr:hypothetical protein [Shimia abyssi]PSL20015.1 hypothetical protein CLV88_10474 [Shimia abyssi]
MIQRVVKITVAALSVAIASEAVAFRTVNNQIVNPVNSVEIEVIGRPGNTKPDFWCAAADFFVRRNAPWKTRIYVKTGIGQGVTQASPNAVVFTTDPAASGVEVYTNNVVSDILTPGYGRSLTYAWGECDKLGVLIF